MREYGFISRCITSSLSKGKGSPLTLSCGAWLCSTTEYMVTISTLVALYQTLSACIKEDETNFQPDAMPPCSLPWNLPLLQNGLPSKFGSSQSNSMCVYRGGVKKFPLQLNVTKIEAVWFGTWRNLDRLHDQDRHVEINLEIISPVAVIHDLGVYLISSSRPWAHKWRTTNVCDAWPVRRQTFPAARHHCPLAGTKIILLGDRGTCVLATCPGQVSSITGRLGFEPATYWSQVWQPTATPRSHTLVSMQKLKLQRKK